MEYTASLGIFFTIFTIVFSDPQWEFYIYETKNVYSYNKQNCTSLGLELARVDSEERWLDAKQIITKNNRHWPDVDIYIGMTYNTSTESFYWEDGTPVSYTKWYSNEPFNADTRPCVVLARNADLYFRTAACDYDLYFSCSKQMLTTTTAPQITTTPATKKEKNLDNMIKGLVIGFTIFGAVVGVCCLLCWCCFSEKNNGRSTVYLPPKMPTKSTKAKDIDKMPVIPTNGKQHSFYVNHAMDEDDEDLRHFPKSSSSWMPSPSPSCSSGVNSMNDSSQAGSSGAGSTKEGSRDNFMQYM